jgi:hypothetical protein
MTPEVFAERLEGRRAGEGRWNAKCPAHEDGRASLSIREGRDGRVLLHCFAGCEVSEIVGRLGLEWRDLFDDPEPYRPVVWRTPKRDRGRELFDHLRRLHRSPTPERMRAEMLAVGRLLLGGTKAFADVPVTFNPDSIRTFTLRLIFQAMEVLWEQGTPRGRFSPLALSREIDCYAERFGHFGYASEMQITWWCWLAIGLAKPGRARGALLVSPAAETPSAWAHVNGAMKWDRNT